MSCIHHNAPEAVFTVMFVFFVLRVFNYINRRES